MLRAAKARGCEGERPGREAAKSRGCKGERPDREAAVGRSLARLAGHLLVELVQGAVRQELVHVLLREGAKASGGTQPNLPALHLMNFPTRGLRNMEFRENRRPVAKW